MMTIATTLIMFDTFHNSNDYLRMQKLNELNSILVKVGTFYSLLTSSAKVRGSPISIFASNFIH